MKLPAITITRESLEHFDEAIQKEWLVTNGIGGYASSTVLGMNTRKYHGLLVAALHPPGDRTVCLAKLDEEVSVGNNIYQLGTNEFFGKNVSRGYIFIKDFSLNPFPRCVYEVQNVEVIKTIFMPQGKNAVAVNYKFLNRGRAGSKIRVYPLLTCRHFHSVLERRKSWPIFSLKQNGGEVEFTFNNPKATIMIRSIMGEFKEKANWIEKLYYREEASRGESSTEDCYQPGYFEVMAPNRGQIDFAVITVASENSQECRDMLDSFGSTVGNFDGQFASEIAERENLLTNFYNTHRKVPTNELLNWLLLAKEAFIVNGAGNRKSVIAGYFWFETWGRDTFISLPGLLLATGRFEDARRLLLDFMRYSKQGLIPNFIHDGSGEAAYNTVDATLWYFNAVLQYLKYTGDFNFVRQQLWESLKVIVESHKLGTAFGIKLDSDGLLAHGPGLTWMDAKVEGELVTPRDGKAVEIQALWYNSLKTTQLLAKKFNEVSLAEKYAEMAVEAQESFYAKFWNGEEDCLFDVVNASGVDASLRPNQIIAVALDFTMLDHSRSERIVEAVRRKMATPFGLRTLAQSDSRYKGKYFGDRRSRDQAYHNGTVWAWLLGPYVTACCKIQRSSNYELKKRLMFLFDKQIVRAGLGTISEIFDGDPPHIPRGCIAQAWSLAEPLRAYLEDIMLIRPKYERRILGLNL